MVPVAQRRRIGLTGGIGSGKSTVAAMLVEHGVALVDTDAIAREMTAVGGVAMPVLRRHFGDGVVDANGALDRGAMRELVFSQPAALRTLEAVLHPLIGAEAARRAASSDARCVVFDVPLLIESAHWRDRVDRVLVVDCSETTQIDRVLRRSGWTEEAVRRVIASQAPRDRRRACADAVICNDTVSTAELSIEVHALARAWRLE